MISIKKEAKSCKKSVNAEKNLSDKLLRCSLPDSIRHKDYVSYARGLECSRSVWRSKPGGTIVANFGCAEIRSAARAVAATGHIEQVAGMRVE